MQLGMIGLGRMGANLVRRLMKHGHECVVYDKSSAAVEQLSAEGAIGAVSTHDLTLADEPRLTPMAQTVHFTETFTRTPGYRSRTLRSLRFLRVTSACFITVISR